MSALQAIPTPHGIDILNSELKNTVTKYQLIGALTHDAASDTLYSFNTATIETSYFDENGVLTFILNLPIETHFDEYLHRIDVLDSQDQAVIECPTPKIALPKGIGGMVTLKAAISGQAGDVIFKHHEYLTETEFVEVYLSNKFNGTSQIKAVTEKALSDGLATKAGVSTLQFGSYNPNRVYSSGEVCFIKDAETSELSYWQWYSNVESLAGKNPLSRSNRRPGWSNTTKPWYWSPYHAVRPGETVWWGGAELPEDVILDNTQLLPAAVYHRLAAARPDLVTGNNIRMQPASGRFLRAASADYPVGTVHDDAIRNITAKIEIGYNYREGFSNYEGAFTSGENTNSIANNLGASISGDKRLIFDASLAVPTANENQPKGIMEWKGVAI